MLRFSECFGFRKKTVYPKQEPAQAQATTYRGSLSDILNNEKKFSCISRIEVLEPTAPIQSIWYEMRLLFKMLDKNPQVKELSLRDCLTDPTADHHIAQSLEKNTTLETFEVHANRMSETGMHFILNALRENSTLKTFRAFSHNTTDFRYNLTKYIPVIIGNVLQKNKSLKLVDLTDCHIERALLPGLAEVYIKLKNGNPATLKFDSIFTLNVENAINDTLIAKPAATENSQHPNKVKR